MSNIIIPLRFKKNPSSVQKKNPSSFQCFVGSMLYLSLTRKNEAAAGASMITMPTDGSHGLKQFRLVHQGSPQCFMVVLNLWLPNNFVK
jgi:hypothetical protein